MDFFIIIHFELSLRFPAGLGTLSGEKPMVARGSQSLFSIPVLYNSNHPSQNCLTLQKYTKK